MNYAIAITQRGTTLSYWLNRQQASGELIWSLVRATSGSTWQRQLRFATETDAQAFIQEHLGNNPDARVVRVED